MKVGPSRAATPLP